MNDANQQGLARWLFEQLGDSHLLDLLWDSALWGALGAAAGFALGLAVFFLLRAAGALRWEWEHAKWLRGLTAALWVVLWTAGCGAIGLVQGALRGGETVLRRSQLATEAFPVVADAGADLLACLAISAPLLAEGKQAGPAEEAKLDAFRRGEWELDAVALLEGGGAITHAVAEAEATKLEASVLAKFPSWKGGRLNQLLHSGLTVLCDLIMEQAVEEELDKLGEVGRLGKRLVAELPQAAAATGDPRTISRTELSSHLVQEGIVPAALIPLRQFARGQQLAALLVLLVGTLVPVGAFRLAEFLRARASTAGSAAGPGSPAADAP
jgi:hypothetical protein